MPKFQKYSLASAFLFLLAGCTSTPQPLIWQGDFATSDFGQWSYLVNPQGLTLEESCRYDGRYAGRVTLSGNAEMLWNGNENLNRSEFNYKPAVGRIDEGKDTYFGWSFFLERPLTNNKHELGYWESENSWQQMFRFNLTETDLSFQETANQKYFWRKEDFAIPGVWHDVALHIHWSTDPVQGFVQVWLDGKDMGVEHFQTLHTAGENMFTQIGLLRKREDAVETLLIDNVREGKTMAAVLREFDQQKPMRCQ